MTEAERVRSIFETRDRNSQIQERWQLLNPTCLHIVQERERFFLSLLRRQGFTVQRLERAAILSLGCGVGTELLDLVRYGATPSRVIGIDLEPQRLSRAKLRNPGSEIVEADAGALPFHSDRFDLVLQFTLLTSVLDVAIRRQIATEMLRVLRPDGMIVWYDFWSDNPRNPDVKGIRTREIHALFPNCTYDSCSLTVPPPLGRWLVPRSWFLADVVSRIFFLKSFHLVGIRKTCFG